MVSLESAENALKSFYLDAVRDALDLKTSPFLAKVERSTDNVYGKDVKKLIRIGLHGGVMAGTEAGDLPQTDKSNYAQLTIGLKNLYGTIEISDKAIRASQSNEGAFVNLLNGEMDNLLKSAKYHFARMLMGDGKGRVAKIDGWVDDQHLKVYATSGLAIGMRVFLRDENGETMDNNEERTIVAIDREKLLVEFSGSTVPDDINSGYICCSTEADELTGLEALYSDSVYGLTEETYAKIKPAEIYLESDIDEIVIQKMIDLLEESSGSAPNLIICSAGVRRALLQYYMDMSITPKAMEIEGGFQALDFNGIPVVADRFCPHGTMYFINTDDFKLYQLCDWQWMESEDGKILRQIPGKPVYTATLVKYAELVCTRPNGVGRLVNIPEV